MKLTIELTEYLSKHMDILKDNKDLKSKEAIDRLLQGTGTDNDYTDFLYECLMYDVNLRRNPQGKVVKTNGKTKPEGK